MARIAGVNIPTNKQVWVALTYIHGIGQVFEREVRSATPPAITKRPAASMNCLTQKFLKIREHIDANHHG